MNSFTFLKQVLLIIQLITSLGLSVDALEVNGFNQRIYTIKATINTPIIITQKLSQNQVFGFQTLSEMSEATGFNKNGNSFNNKGSNNDRSSLKKIQHELGVNGMFYDSFGHPAGILIIDGSVITSKTIGTPMILIKNNGKVSIEDITLAMFVEYKGKKYLVQEVNGAQVNGTLSVYTPWFGETDRIQRSHVVLTVKNNKVIQRIVTDGAFSTGLVNMGLNKGDFLTTYQTFSPDFNVTEGDTLTFVVESNVDISDVEEGFQSGGWLVKNGENVTKPYENYMGRTDSLQPRTAIGITEDNKIIVKVVDGREKGVSDGVSGYQLAQLFIEEQCVSAAFLDGGASTTLVKDGIVMNVPSLGEEKKISHGLFFDRDYSKILAK